MDIVEGKDKMKALKEKILNEGKVISEDVLDVKSFLNEVIDVELMESLGQDFAKAFAEFEFDAFLTVEASGIAPSVFASLHAQKPLIVLKKSDHKKDPAIYAQVSSYSFTKKNAYYLSVTKERIQNKRFILLDDFLAKGNVVLNTQKLLQKEGSELVAVGICIAKNFQEGHQRIQEAKIPLYIQAGLASLEPENNAIHFVKE